MLKQNNVDTKKKQKNYYLKLTINIPIKINSKLLLDKKKLHVIGKLKKGKRKIKTLPTLWMKIKVKETFN